jgi:hypothetical protein
MAALTLAKHVAQYSVLRDDKTAVFGNTGPTGNILAIANAVCAR